VFANTAKKHLPPGRRARPSERAPLIEVSVDALEISESNSNVLGILWGQQGAVTNGIPAFDTNRLNFLETVPTPAIFDAGKLNRSGLFAQIQAQIQNNQLRVLANPTLLTKSGFEATFLVGGEIAYPTPAPVGQAPGVDFKKFGVSLKNPSANHAAQTRSKRRSTSASPTPTVTLGTTIAGTNVPGLSAREAVSKVEVNDGETVVLAGIKQSRRNKIITKIPILGSIPLLGLSLPPQGRNSEPDLSRFLRHFPPG